MKTFAYFGQAGTFLGMAAMLCMSGCSAGREAPKVTQPVMQPAVYQEPAPTYDNPGSLYNPNQFRSIYEDGRARRVGDIVTINVIEQQSGSQEVTTDATRDNTHSLTVSALANRNSLFGIPIGASSPIFDASSSSDFSGDAESTRNSTITATLAARVINVLPDGNLQIEAVREITLNNETQFMVVTGIIRARDISASNTIASTQIANAKIEYYGQGVLSQKQKPGWLSRFLEMISPF